LRNTARNFCPEQWSLQNPVAYDFGYRMNVLGLEGSKGSGVGISLIGEIPMLGM
jgi:hypothetical protein